MQDFLNFLEKKTGIRHFQYLFPKCSHVCSPPRTLCCTTFYYHHDTVDKHTHTLSYDETTIPANILPSHLTNCTVQDALENLLKPILYTIFQLCYLFLRSTNFYGNGDDDNDYVWQRCCPSQSASQPASNGALFEKSNFFIETNVQILLAGCSFRLGSVVSIM